MAKAVGKTFGVFDCIERGLNAGNIPCSSKSGPPDILEEPFQVKLLNRKRHKDFVTNIGLDRSGIPRNKVSHARDRLHGELRTPWRLITVLKKMR